MIAVDNLSAYGSTDGTCDPETLLGTETAVFTKGQVQAKELCMDLLGPDAVAVVNLHAAGWVGLVDMWLCATPNP